jgi:hypothetical protein
MTRQLAGAAVLFAGYLFLHLPVEDFFDMLASRFGFETYDRLAFAGFVAVGIAVLFAAWAWPSRRRLLIGGSVTALVALMAIVQRLLVVVSIENIHYPQYALLMWMLSSGLPSVEGSWLVAAGLGVVDEGYQYVALPRGTPDYFDWNDVVLNAIGATLGAVAVIAFRSGRVQAALLSTRVALAIAIALIAVTFVLDPPVLTPFYSHTPGGRAFHKLSAAEATMIIAGLWSGVGAMNRASRRAGL